jgi:hypothetical protein
MVFVHARKETVKTAMGLKEAAMTEGSLDKFSCEEHPQWSIFRRNIGESRNKEMKQLFDHGFGIHHAGMLRTDRNMMERMFEARAIKVDSILMIPLCHTNDFLYRFCAVQQHWRGESTCLLMPVCSLG